MDSPPSHQLQMLQNRGKELLKENVYMLKIVFVKIKCTGLLTQPWLTNFQSQESQLLCWAWVLHLKARWLFGDEVLQDAQQHPQPPLQDVSAPLCQSWQPKCIQTSPSISWGTVTLSETLYHREHCQSKAMVSSRSLDTPRASWGISQGNPLSLDFGMGVAAMPALMTLKCRNGSQQPWMYVWNSFL